MRLINIHSLELAEFFELDIPSYYILSHRWGKHETTFKDFRKKRNVDSEGYLK
jgi:hypothetical protein